MVENEETLYIMDNKKKTRVWKIFSIGSHICMEHGILNGTMIREKEIVYEGKQKRTVQEQVESRIRSRVNKMLDKGYSRNINEATGKPTNALGLIKPMLAQPLDKVNNIDWARCFVQYKYDGNRCLVTKQGGEIIAYSRNGKLIHSIDHILKHIDIPEGYTIDGELYRHGEILQDLASMIRKEQNSSANLHYVIYDITMELEYEQRLEMLHILEREFIVKTQDVYVAPTKRITTKDEALAHMNEARQLGYEGAILRHGLTGYEDGKRSKSLVKIKEMRDDEFKVIRIDQAREGWAILVCLTHKGEEFSVSAPGTFNMKHHIAKHRDTYINKYVRVEFAYYTKDGIPFHPIATNFVD